MTRTHIPKIILLLAILVQSCSTKDPGLTQPATQVTLVQGNIYTIAGTGQTGFGGNNGPAVRATLLEPQGVAVDSLGNLYVAESGNALVRQINPAGEISIFAGVLTQSGDAGDGGQAVAAQLGYITDVAVDKWGNVYLTDGSSNVIRKVTASSGMISTIAGVFIGTNIPDQTPYTGDGGPAVSAHINVPLGLTVGKTGNVYFVDAGNSVIRKIDGASGVMTTIGGDRGINTGSYGGDGSLATSASLVNSYEVALDASENVYIAHTDDNAIRKISASTGIITTVAGMGTTTTGYSGDGGPATSARLNNPQGVALDAAGNIYIADSGNNVIRKVDVLTGTISTIVGSGPGRGYSGDGGPATSAKLSQPMRIAVDKSGVIYIADEGNNVIRAVKQ